ncbi:MULTISPECIES: glucose-6-phosphate dehydrogenase [unclassified Leptolyngbya]|uniref:glucose-6-phosphate dehydrogenase n=1 Tax=unclassified Leptolyngbya TaxID=2650499 RepID=UPI0016833C80|nr:MULTISPECIES: glucose-6-phosphate dehydrogenase [unclassified Leptolyngbya]MBD1913145.1 glucose-6-phosphate dehydrogenase [Leptolyngbya sp. FACHB-8]MBD2158816.1 glucose-6-phosphate dehydrogenase [Leptolyngbya sp. FACHB-16]
MTVVTVPNPQTKSPTRPATPCAIVIFGAAGDLTKRLLMPALYNLRRSNLLPQEFAIVGVAHTPMSQDDFRSKLNRDIHEFATVDVDDQLWQQFEQRLYYLPGEFQNAKTYQQLQELLTQVDRDCGTQGNYLFYLATSSNFFCDIITQLGTAGLAREDNKCWRRVIIEKPFGHDLESARTLNQNISHVLEESQVYRIDHYLGKETVQNILVFRFGNGLFEPIWNRNHIDHVQITVAETVGVEGRGNFYEGTGAVRDMVQNHLFQLLTMVAMEPPVSFDADAVRDEKSKLLKAVQPFTAEAVQKQTVRGQYGEGAVNGEMVPAYRSEPRVAADSTTETYAALKLTIDNWRWAGVPFYLRTGKRLPKRVTEVAVQFKQVPSLLFRDTSIDHLTPNFLVLRIQPDEGINFQFGAKIPGPTMQMGAVNMNFCYADYFGTTPSTGYETLLYDCMIGDATLFQRSDNVELGWSIVSPILDAWTATSPQNFPNYAASTWGPKDADELLYRDGRRWRSINS